MPRSDGILGIPAETPVREVHDNEAKEGVGHVLRSAAARRRGEDLRWRESRGTSAADRPGAGTSEVNRRG